MKYIKQFSLIVLFSFIGELLNYLLPLPIPGSIYGILLLFFSLEFKIISLSQVKETGKFLIEIMPIMFIPAATGLISIWPVLKSNIVAYIVIVCISTVLVMGISGKVVDWMVSKDDRV